jgi:hypothetical protein
MSRPEPAVEISEKAVSTPSRRADTGIRAAAGVTVAALAGIAGAISYSHMRELAAAHGETGWQAHTFPLSVDGIEIVASLVLLADRRTGRSSGWLPWAALAAGTTASLAANVAAAGTDLVGRVVAGWPAFALLVAVKLLSQLLEPRRDADRPAPAVDERPVPANDCSPRDGAGDDLRMAAGPLPDPPVPAIHGPRADSSLASTQVPPYPADGNGHLGSPVTGTVSTAHRGTGRGNRTATIKPGTGTGASAGTGTTSDIADLLPAARAARDRLSGRGEALTRDTLAAQLRRDGYSMRNARVSRLLSHLKLETADQNGTHTAAREPAALSSLATDPK